MRRVLIGAGALHRRLYDPLRRLFPGAHFWLAYGMTECASSITCCSLAETAETSSHGGNLVGCPGQQVEIQIMDTQDGADSPAPSSGPGHLPPGTDSPSICSWEGRPVLFLACSWRGQCEKISCSCKWGFGLQIYAQLCSDGLQGGLGRCGCAGRC